MQSNTDTHALATAPIGKLLGSYSAPAILASIISSLSGLISAFFIGHGVGGIAIPALAITFPVFTIIMAFGMLVGVGGATLMSISLGQDDTDTAFRVLGNVTILTVLTGVPIALLIYLFLDPLLILFGASELTLPLARMYMVPFLCALLPCYPMLTLSGLMRASGYPRKALWIAVGSIVVNILLGPVLIFHFGLGMVGASLMSSAGILFGSIFSIHHFIQKKNLIHFKKGIFKFDLRIITSIFKIGMPSFLMNACACFIVMYINQILAKHGGDIAIGAYGVFSRIAMLFLMAVGGLGQGMQPIIGFNFGARRLDRVYKTMKYGIVIAAITGCASFIVIQTFPQAFAYIFAPTADLLGMSSRAIQISTLALPLMCVQIILTGFFISIGVSSLSIILSLSRQILFFLPLLAILPNFFGTDGVWLSIAMADLISFFFALCIFIWYKRKLSRTLYNPHN